MVEPCASTAIGGSGTAERRKTRPELTAAWYRSVLTRRGTPGERVGSAAAEIYTRPLGTVCQYVLLKTTLPRCHSWFGFGGFGGWS